MLEYLTIYQSEDLIQELVGTGRRGIDRYESYNA